MLGTVSSRREDYVGHEGIRIADGARILYCYLDERGSADRRSRATPLFMCTTLATDDPDAVASALLHAKYRSIAEEGRISNHDATRSYFHATDDPRRTRTRVLEALASAGGSFRFYPAWEEWGSPALEDLEPWQAYKLVAGRSFEAALSGEAARAYDHVFLFADRIPVGHHKYKAISQLTASVRATLGGSPTFTMCDMSSESDFGLQAADYCCWAVQRDLLGGDPGPLSVILGSLRL